MGAQTAFTIGVDLGATKIAAALVSPQGQIVASSQAPTLPAEGEEAVLGRIATQVNALTAQSPEAVAGVGIGSPGRVNPDAGIVYNAVNLGWEAVKLAEGVRSRLANDMPVRIEKDTNAGALGEYYLGAAKDCRDFVYVTVGSGLGGGVFANGGLISGANYNASELGHLSLDPNGRECVCGLRGCAETVVSGNGLLAVTREKLAEGKISTQLTDSDSVTTAAIIAAARAGDELALAALAEVARWLGMVMAACAAVTNPALIVLGGGLGLAASEFLIPGACAELRRRVLPASHQPMQVALSQLTSSAVGAATLVWHAQ
jgi:glucokinase